MNWRALYTERAHTEISARRSAKISVWVRADFHVDLQHTTISGTSVFLVRKIGFPNLTHLLSDKAQITWKTSVNHVRNPFVFVCPLIFWYFAGQTRCDYTPQTRDQYLIYTDKSLEAFSDASCRQACTQERDFNCRSYSFLSEVPQNITSFFTIYLWIPIADSARHDTMFVEQRHAAVCWGECIPTDHRCTLCRKRLRTTRSSSEPI